MALKGLVPRTQPFAMLQNTSVCFLSVVNQEAYGTTLFCQCFYFLSCESGITNTVREHPKCRFCLINVLRKIENRL